MMRLTSCTLIFLAALLTGSVSCKKQDENPGQATKVAILAYGTTFDDMAFLQSCKRGLERAKDDFGLSSEYDIDTSTNRYVERLDQYAVQGFSLVIAVGYMWSDAVSQSARNHPGTKYILVDSELPVPEANAVSILFSVDEAAFPLGWLSAWWAYTHDRISPSVGFVGAVPIPQVRQFSEPFLNGVNRFNEQYGTAVGYHGVYAGTFIDEAMGAHLADSLITAGSDVMFGVGGQTGNGALLRARDRLKPAIGVDVDQYISFPEVSGMMLSSAIKGLDNAIYDVIRSYIENRFPGGRVYSGNLANLGVQMAPWHDFDPLIPDSVKTSVELIRTGIIDGTISTGWTGR